MEEGKSGRGQEGFTEIDTIVKKITALVRSTIEVVTIKDTSRVEFRDTSTPREKKVEGEGHWKLALS